ncbi:MAG: hypothetical protein ACYTF9_15230, partial [Planctomycetota bacterium]
SYAPEQAIDLGGAYDGKNGRSITWETVPDDGWMMTDFARYGDDALDLNSIAYLHRTISVERAASVEFEMGSDDGMKVWLNGRLLLDADLYRGMNIQDHRVTLDLRGGENTLLVKVTQGQGQWQFQMRPRVEPRFAALLAWHLNEAFPPSREAEHYRLLTVLEPEEVVLEVGGLDVDDRGRVIVATRRGDIWIVEGADANPPFECDFTRFASGLHEPLGVLWQADGTYVVQRGELTRLEDVDGDDRADRFVTVSDRWGVSGNYHEFAFGPKLDHEGRLWVTLNLGFCASLGKSIVPWRGWALTMGEAGALEPICGGLRSPNGLGVYSDGAMFYTDNQGDWVGTNKLSHLAPGSWHGHPGSNRWYADAGLPEPTEADFAQPAIWFPYDKMGRSASDLVLDATGGAFGPFEGQLFVGDQYAATIMRVDLEKIDGLYQGACFPFRADLDCGVNRLVFGPDGSLYAGLTNRGWWSYGNRPWGLQRLVYTGRLPFETHSMRVTPDGFLLRFTKPVDPATASDVASYAMERYTYNRWERYGSPEIETKALVIREAAVSADGREVRLVVGDRRGGFVHELRMAGVRSADGETLLHEDAYYTLHVIPDADE